MPQRERPFVNGNFQVQLGDVSGDSAEAGFSEVVLPRASAQVIEYRNGNEKQNQLRKMPGQMRYENVILKRGFIGANNLASWWEEVQDGNIPGCYRQVVIELHTEDRAEVVCVWKLQNAWPADYRFSTLNGEGGDILMEVVELAYEGMQVEFP